MDTQPSIRNYLRQIFRSVWGVIGLILGVLGLVGGVLSSLGYSIPNFPLWAWIVILTVGLLLAPFQLYKKQTEEIKRLKVKNGSNKPAATLDEKLELLLEEGKNLRRLSVAMGENPPIMKAENWRVRVKALLGREYGKAYGDRWEAHTASGNSKQKFSGVAMTNQIKLWQSLTAGVERLEEIWQQTK